MTGTRTLCTLLVAGLVGCGADSQSGSTIPTRTFADADTVTQEADSDSAPPDAASSAEQPTSSLPASAAAQDGTELAAADQPRRHTVRKVEVQPRQVGVPPVLLTTAHAKICKVGVGDQFPEVKLPALDGEPLQLSEILGKQATVVLFWNPDRWMARTALRDLQRDIADKMNREDVAVVGVAVEQPQTAVHTALIAAEAEFLQLMDSEGKVFDAVGGALIPRIYVLDPQGKIVWFDIEYSEGTRRDLSWSLEALAGDDE